jgi:cell wall-associated NlpC family hydrolase
MPDKGVGVTAVGIGGILIYSGIRGYSVLKAAQNITAGNSASTGQTVSLLANGTGDTSGGSQVAVGGSSLVNAMMASVGHAYLFGGAPGPDGTRPWDCSSCVNFNANIKSDLPIPGAKAGQYNTNQHGPPTGSWLLWGGMTTVGHSSSLAQPGDLCIWQTHMGVCVAPGKMVSALNPGEGTKETDIDIISEVLFVRRYGGSGGLVAE